MNLSNALRTFNGLIGKYAVIFLESQNTVIGTSKLDANGDFGLAGIPMSDIYTRPWRPSDGTNVANYTTEFSFDPVYINEKIAFKKVSFDSYLLAELVGLEDIHLSFAAGGEPTEGGVNATVIAETDCGSTDVFDLYATELAQAVAWNITDAANVAKTILTVTQDVDLKGWDITLGGGDVFEDGDKISLAAPSVLGAAPINVVGYESDILIVDLGS